MKPRRMNYDLPLDEQRAPEPGDIIVGRRVVYQVIESRPVDSRVWGNRWALTLRRLNIPWTGCMDDWLGLRERFGCNALGTAPHFEWTFSSYAKRQTPANYFGVTPGQED